MKQNNYNLILELSNISNDQNIIFTGSLNICKTLKLLLNKHGMKKVLKSRNLPKDTKYELSIVKALD